MGADPPEVPSDRQLLERLRRDDTQALASLMGRYFDDIVGIAFHYTRTIDVASDIAQEVFIHLWERRASLDAAGNVVHYLRRAARNTALNSLRHEATVARLQQAAAREWTMAHPYWDNSGVHKVERDEFNARVSSILERLSPRVQEVALLYHERGLEPGEIAILLGVAPQTIYNQLRTAMRALSQAFYQEKTSES